MNKHTKIKLLKKIDSLREFVEKQGEQKTFETCNGLMWSNLQSEGNWNDAIEFAKNCRDGGYDDWRLPTVSELQNVIDYEKGEPKIGGFKNIYYWSATTKADNTHNAWRVYLGNGYTSGNNKTNLGYNIRCVRNL